MRVSLIQTNGLSDKHASLQAAERLARRAIERDRPRLVMFPEHFDWSGGTVAEKVAAGEPERDGPAYAMCQGLAREFGIYVHTGSFYEQSGRGDKVYNTSVVFDPQGREIARYRKIHMFDIVTPDGMRYGESDAVAPGSEVVVAQVDGVRVGLAICYDLRFPELFQRLVREGAQVIVLPAAFTLQTGKDHWEVLCRARAIETQCYFLACGQFGPFSQGGQTRHNYGHSLVCDPWGHVIAKASDGEGHVSAWLDMDRVAQVRQQIPLEQHKVL